MGKNDIGYRTREKEKILIVSAQDKTERQKWERKERVRMEARFRQLHHTVLSWRSYSYSSILKWLH